jgi:hypothetical protein
MPEIHGAIGIVVVGVFALGWLWGLGAAIFRRGRGPGDLYWRWLTVAQVVAGLEAILGIALLLIGRRVSVAGEGLGNVLHYVYGLLPILLFVIAHVIARSGDLSMLGMRRSDGEPVPISPWVPFAWASFISFGLTLRALMTGLGVG